MGYGLGAAIGAKCGNPDKTVVNIAGDGSFHMNLNELVTLSKHNIPVVELVINNNVLGMVLSVAEIVLRQEIFTDDA